MRTWPSTRFVQLNDMARGLTWGDLPGELHREILQLVPLRDAAAARAVSREMCDEVDEVWRAWGIRATNAPKQMVSCTGPLWVYLWRPGSSAALHLASTGKWRLALFQESKMSLTVAIEARKGPQGYAMSEEEVADLLRRQARAPLRNRYELLNAALGRGLVDVVKQLPGDYLESIVNTEELVEPPSPRDPGVTDDPLSVGDDAWKSRTLASAAAMGQANLCRYLVKELGAKVDGDGSDGGVTPLMLAAERCREEACRVLVEELSADVHARDRDEATALHCAARNGYASGYELLVKCGADPEAVDIGGVRPSDFLIDDPSSLDAYEDAYMEIGYYIDHNPYEEWEDPQESGGPEEWGWFQG